MNRRDFIKGSVALALAGASTTNALAAPQGVGPSAALDRLKEGNKRFMKDLAGGQLDLKTTRAQLAGGQAPFASILGCADSRTPPEMIFDCGLGDLFVVRVAGNLADDENHAVMGSLEFGSLVLGSQLVVVLGHSACGAVNAAIAKLQGGERAPGAIGYLVSSIKPAVELTKKEGGEGDLLDRCIATNVRLEVERLKKNAILKDLMGQGRLQIVGGVYDLATGAVRWL